MGPFASLPCPTSFSGTPVHHNVPYLVNLIRLYVRDVLLDILDRLQGWARADDLLRSGSRRRVPIHEVGEEILQVLGVDGLLCLCAIVNGALRLR